MMPAPMPAAVYSARARGLLACSPQERLAAGLALDTRRPKKRRSKHDAMIAFTDRAFQKAHVPSRRTCE